MRSVFRKAAVAAVAGLSLVAVTVAGSSSAEARHWRGGAWVGPAIVGGLALGALAAASRPYGYGYYGYPGYGYYGGGCVWQRRVVGYNQWGRPIVRPVQVCY